GDVEQPGRGAHGAVLLDDPGILDRHLPAGEIDHPRRRLQVAAVQRRRLQALAFRHWIDPPRRRPGPWMYSRRKKRYHERGAGNRPAAGCREENVTRAARPRPKGETSP